MMSRQPIKTRFDSSSIIYEWLIFLVAVSLNKAEMYLSFLRYHADMSCIKVDTRDLKTGILLLFFFPQNEPAVFRQVNSTADSH